MTSVVLWIVAIVFVPLVVHCLVLTYRAMWDTWRMWYKEYKVNASWRAYDKNKGIEDDEEIRKKEAYEYMLYTLASAAKERKERENDGMV